MPLSRVQPAQYQQLLQDKVNRVSALMAPYSPPEANVYPSVPTGFRLRAEFRIWHEGDDLNFVMFRRDEPKNPIPITDFPIADPLIQKLMPTLRTALARSDVLRRKLFQVEFLSTLAGDMLVTLAYHRKLDEQWSTAAQALQKLIEADNPNCSIIGRSRKQKVVLGKDYVEEELTIEGTNYRYRQYEQAFSQPNGRVNIEMITWACKQAAQLSGDLLELYCGNGNFTLPLSRHFDNVIATELSKTSIRAARTNMEANQIQNVQVIRLAAEEVTQAMNGEREFRRLRELPKPIEQYDLGTIFVDPPRAGLDQNTLTMAARFATIIYISCNPDTLAENLKTLCKSHQLISFALFDQFPYTDHMECGVVLQRM